MSHPITPGGSADRSHDEVGHREDRFGSSSDGDERSPLERGGRSVPAPDSRSISDSPSTPDSPSTTQSPEWPAVTHSRRADNHRDPARSSEQALVPPEKALVPPQEVEPAPTVVLRDNEPTDLLTQEKNQFGGVKVGAALLGWLTTIGTIALLAAILAAIASGLHLDRNTSTADLKGVGLGAAIALLVVLFLGYLAGGYVAGRMSRFHGVRQGLAVWLWGLLIAIVLSITAAIVGSQSTILIQANLPQIPFTANGFTWQAILALIAVLLVTLLGALLGGLLGMRFHRRIDRFAAHSETV